MRTKQHGDEKTALIFKQKQDFQGSIFMVEGFIADTVQNVPFFNRQVGSLQNNTSLGADLLMC